MISAVVLSARPVTTVIPGVQVVPHVSVITSPQELLEARLAAIMEVSTPWFFFLDDDDELPENYPGVLDRCMNAGAPLAYTNELIRTEHGPQLRRSGPYSQDAHIADITFVHHLAVCSTAAAREVIPTLPRGRYGFEPLFYFQLARRGAAWVDETGYIWNCRSGLHRQPFMLYSMVSSAAYSHRNR